jgi:hypothetical protein
MVGQIQGEGSIFLVFKQIGTPSISAFNALKIINHIIELKKLWAPKVEGMKNSKNKPPNDIEVNSQTPKKSLYLALLLL